MMRNNINREKGKKGVDVKQASGEDEEDGEGASDIPQR